MKALDFMQKSLAARLSLALRLFAGGPVPQGGTTYRGPTAQKKRKHKPADPHLRGFSGAKLMRRAKAGTVGHAGIK